MKLKMFLVFFIIAVSAVLVSCQEETVASTKLSIRLSDKSMDSRTIMPASALMQTRKYIVSGTGPGSESFGPIQSLDSTITVDDLSVGQWTITARAVNAEDNDLAYGSGDFFIGRGQNDVTLILDQMPGTGQFLLNLIWDDDITYLERITLEVNIQDISGNEVYSVSRESDTASEGISVLIPLDAGSYLVSVNVSDQEGSLDIGAADAVRIIKGTTSSGTMHLQASNTNHIGKPSFVLDNRVGGPMSFYLDYSPKDISVGDQVTLSAVCESLDSSIDTSSLFYQWFRDGVLLHEGNASTYKVSALRGLHRYDVIVRSNVMGTMCGASMTLNVI